MRPCAFEDVGDRGVHLLLLADVARAWAGAWPTSSAISAATLASFSALRPTSAMRGAEAGELVRGAAADAAAAAGDDDHLSGEQLRPEDRLVCHAASGSGVRPLAWPVAIIVRRSGEGSDPLIP